MSIKRVCFRLSQVMQGQTMLGGSPIQQQFYGWIHAADILAEAVNNRLGRLASEYSWQWVG